jgi:hypothetical protein
MLAGAGGTLVYFWGLILPWVITMLTNTLSAIALAGIIAVIGVVIFDPRWRNLIAYAYKSAMRGLTGLFIEIDPIGILKTYVHNLKDRLNEMDTSIGNLNGQLKKLKTQIDKNDADRTHNLQMAQQAQKHGENPEMRNVIVLQSRQAGRLQKSNLTLQNLYDRMANLLRVLQKMRAASALLVDDIQGEVEVKTAERAALLAGYNAFSKAKKIMQGGGDEREMFDMTMDKLADDYGLKMGEIETFMDMSKGVINGMELDNGIYEADAMAQLEAWEQKSHSLLLSSPPPGVRVDTQEGVRVSTQAPTSEFSDLFNDPSNGDQKAARR